MKGQGLIEYALILVLIAVVVIIALALLFPGDNPCFTKGKESFECRNQQVEQCLKTEQYTKDQCVILVGGK